jgi:signal recognition particle subunit SRP54
MLADLGKKLSATLQQLSSATVIDEKFLDDVLRDVCKALLEADVKWVASGIGRRL